MRLCVCACGNSFRSTQVQSGGYQSEQEAATAAALLLCAVRDYCSAHLCPQLKVQLPPSYFPCIRAAEAS